MCPVTYQYWESSAYNRQNSCSLSYSEFLVAEYKQYTKYKKYMVCDMTVNAKEKKPCVA